MSATPHLAGGPAPRAPGGGQAAARRKMFARMVTRSLTRRRSRVAIAILAVGIGATTLFALATIATDIPRQMTREMRAFGGNLLVLPAEGAESIPASAVPRVDAVVGEADLVGSAPYRYQTLRLNEQPYLAAGTDLGAVRAVSPYWYVEGAWPAAPGEILIGQDVAEWVGIEVGGTVELVAAAPGAAELPAPSLEPGPEDPAEGAAGAGGTSSDVTGEAAEERLGTFTVTGVATTGGEEDSMLFMELTDLEELTGVEGVLDAVEYSVALNGEQIEALAAQVTEDVDAVSAAAVKRLTRSDSYVLDMLKALLGLVSGIVLALTMIGVSTTMMAVVAERRNEIALLKALGADDKSVERQFLVEGLALGVIGGALGCGLGYACALAVSVTVFHRSVAFNPWLALGAVALSAAVAYGASLLPVRRTAAVDPALVLRGE